MIKFLLNREIASKLEINLAKWKRWSREFLPPDPLGGLQSGYARQYSPNEAFKVFLGGHLVADLKYSIPEAKRILDDLRVWLTEKGFYGSQPGVDAIGAYEIRISERRDAGRRGLRFSYGIREIFSQAPAQHDGVSGSNVFIVEYTLDTKSKSKENGVIDIRSIRVLFITDIYRLFVSRLY